MHPEVFDTTEDLGRGVQDVVPFTVVRYTREAGESKALNTQHGPMVIIAASGMCEAGRILHHLAHNASDPRTTILIVGFQANYQAGLRVLDIGFGGGILSEPLARLGADMVGVYPSAENIEAARAHAEEQGVAID